MTKMDHRAAKAIIGIVLTLVFVMITAVSSLVPSADAALYHHGGGKKVQGDVDLQVQPAQGQPPAKANSVLADPANPNPLTISVSVNPLPNSGAPANPEAPANPGAPANPEAPASSGSQASTLTINLHLRNIPKGQHKADIHQGSCPLNFSLNGQSPANGPFTPGVTLPLGKVEAKADGTLNKKLTFQVGGDTGIPADLLTSGKWFFCIHAGTLSEIQGTTPNEKFASLQTFLKTKEGPGQVQQLACQALNGTTGKSKLTIHINGVPKASPPPENSPAPSPAASPATPSVAKSN